MDGGTKEGKKKLIHSFRFFNLMEFRFLKYSFKNLLFIYKCGYNSLSKRPLLTKKRSRHGKSQLDTLQRWIDHVNRGQTDFPHTKKTLESVSQVTSWTRGVNTRKISMKNSPIEKTAKARLHQWQYQWTC